jgi:hypothetical protein
VRECGSVEVLEDASWKMNRLAFARKKISLIFSLRTLRLGGFAGKKFGSRKVAKPPRRQERKDKTVAPNQ